VVRKPKKDIIHVNRICGILIEVASQTSDMTKRLMSSPKYRSVKVINNLAKPGSNQREVNYINYK
jgi:hypothetical protein